MRYRLLAVGVLVAGTAAASADLLACGDKFLMPSRGATFAQAYRASHPGSILIYAPGGASPDSWRSAKLQAALAQAGHHVSVAKDASQIAGLVASGRVDIVLADFGVAASIGAQAGAGSTEPVLLPVMQIGGKAETAACKQKYSCQLKSEDKPERFLVTVNAAMTSRVKALQAKTSSGH